MTKMKSKTIANVVALFLMFAMAVSFVALPAANAQYTKKSYPYVGAMPNPVGVGQEVLIHLGISDPTVHPQEGWEGLTVTVERPDGKTDTLGPFKTDTTGGTGTVYVPTISGTYYLQTHFPEQVIEYERAGRTFPVGTIMQASDSDKLALNVTDEPRTYYPDEPLPSEYWTRPINTQLRAWGEISGNWLQTPLNRYAPYNDAPEAPHVLWATPLAEGGVVGGDLGVQGYETGDAYEGKFSGSVILNGVVYFNRQIGQNRPSGTGDAAQSLIEDLNIATLEQEVVAVDLKTGKELWSQVLGNNERLSFGQQMYWKTMNMYGGFAYLWTTPGRGDPPDTPWRAYDPLTGRWEYSMTNVPSGTRVFGPNGEILIYTIDTRNGWMTQWNSTSAEYMTYLNIYLHAEDFNTYSSAFYWAQRWRPQGLTIDCSTPYNASMEWIETFPASSTTLGIDWNVSIPTDLPGSANYVFPEDRIVGSSISGTNPQGGPPVVIWGLNLKHGQEGQVMFKESWQPPAGDLSLSSATASLEDKVFTIRAKEIRAFFGFSMDTGKYLWGPTESRGYMDLFMGGPSGERGMIAYGKLYLGTVAGALQCVDVQTGETLWTYEMSQPYTELMWGQNNWPIEFGFISDGKIYLLHTEHSGNSPLPRGAPFVCLNATTGEVIFRVDGLLRATVWGGDPMIADSTMVMFNTYDNRIYAVGKGPSATTVAASPKVSVHGSSVLVEGMVTDVSPGTADSVVAMRFPGGVPAVSDASMGEWMKYVYAQFERPTDATGVEVVVSVVDPNSNSYEVGRATSDADGFFKLSFTPEVPGEYTIIASFDGSGAYYGSFAQTAVGVEEAPAATPEPTPSSTSTADLYLVPGIVGIIVAIAVVGAVIVLMLRKR
jgi:outer membrane protein assembly factor BamB